MNEQETKDFKESANKIFRAPARINLIGEHIDYNGGLVLPACVSLYLTAYVKYRDDNTIRFMSRGFDGEIKTYLNRLQYNDRFGLVLNLLYLMHYSQYSRSLFLCCS